MRDSSDRSYSPAVTSASSRRKRLGGYLVEAGLITPAQVDVALNDQKLTGMRFGEILAARGWVKQQTIEYLMQKVIIPEQQALEREAELRTDDHATARDGRSRSGISPSPQSPRSSREQPARRETPISKPLPSAGQSDEGVNWVG